MEMTKNIVIADQHSNKNNILQETPGHLRPPLEGPSGHEPARGREGGLPPDARGLQQALQIHRKSVTRVADNSINIFLLNIIHT